MLVKMQAGCADHWLLATTVQEAFSKQIWVVRIVEEPPVVVVKMQTECR